MDFPGGSVPFTHQLAFVGGASSPRAPLPAYRCVGARGQGAVSGAAIFGRLARCSTHRRAPPCLARVLRAAGQTAHCSTPPHLPAHDRSPPLHTAPHAAANSTLDSAGREVGGAALPHALPRETAVKMYETMVRLQAVDTIFYEAQRQVGSVQSGRARSVRPEAAAKGGCGSACSRGRAHDREPAPPAPPQGRFAFYMTSSGEEATTVGTAAALTPDDVIFW